MLSLKCEVSLKSDKDKEETILEKCDRFREEGLKFLKTFEEDKTEQERFYKGEHWKNNNSENRARNHVFQMVESEICLLLDPMPSTDIAAHDNEGFGDHALVLGAAKDHVYDEQNLFLKALKQLKTVLQTLLKNLYGFDPFRQQLYRVFAQICRNGR